jgi:predicted metalloprotease with PDZ domain
MKKILLLPFLLISITLNAQKLADVEYTVTYHPNMKEFGIPVHLSLETVGDSTILFYDNELWGVDSLFNNLIVSELENPDLRFKLKPQSEQIIIYHKANEKIRFAYRIKQSFKEPLYDVFIRPVVNNDYFHIISSLLFIIPESYLEFDNPEINVSIHWVNFPDDYVIQTNLGPFTKEMSYSFTLWDKFFDAVFVGGDYRTHKVDVHGKPVFITVRGDWYAGFSDGFFIEKVRNAVSSQREYWNDHEQDYFNVIITPTVSQSDSSYKRTNNVGTALYNGFMIQKTNNPFNNPDNFSYLLHHEMMHHWVGSKIQVRHNQLNKWFKEGFTHYLAFKNRLHTGEISSEEWTKLINKDVLSFHWNNPKRNIPNYVIETDFWKDYNVEKVPYNRGAIFAFWLDNQIILKSDGEKSLDDLMRDLLALSLTEQRKIGDDDILDLAKKYLNTDIDGFFQKHVIVGEDFDLMKEKWIKGISFIEEDGIPVLLTNEDFEGF